MPVCKLYSYGMFGQVFFISGQQTAFYSSRLKSSQECPLNARVPKESILGPTLFLPYIIDLSGYVFCNIAICDEKTTLLSQYDQTTGLVQQSELVYELKFDL